MKKNFSIIVVFMFCFYFIDKFNNFFESQIYFALGIIIALLAYLIDKKEFILAYMYFY